ncbi:MAG: PLP-dependent transferase [Pseudomonadota bacterium]|nr:PLP-dependent transferase [Pseudomonadota bacterium]
MKLSTLVVHAAARPQPETAAVADSIHLSTTFKHAPDGTRAAAGLEYQREAHPNSIALERALSLIEGGAETLCFASGMAAISALMHAIEGPGEVLIGTDVYQGTRSLAREFLVPSGWQVREVDHASAEFAAAIGPGTQLVWLETPSNPLLAVGDIAAAALLSKAHGALLVVDNTFASPALQNPLAFGADVVMHSTTKYLGGHSDVMGGGLVFARADALFDRVTHFRHLHGALLPPFSAWLTLRGLRTLAVRVERHASNALRVAEYLATRPEIERVNYPGLSAHPNHAVAARQMRAFGGMLSFQMRAGRAAALGVAGRLQLFTNATSLGGVESLIEHRASVEGAHPVTADNLLRLSIGLEDAEDLIADLKQALDGI